MFSKRKRIIVSCAVSASAIVLTAGAAIAAPAVFNGPGGGVGKIVKPDPNKIIRIHTDRPESTVLGTLTVTQPERSGWLTAYTCGERRPLASNINFVAGQTVANTIGVRTDDKGDFCVFANVPTHVVFDLVSATAGDDVPATQPKREADTRTDDIPGQLKAGAVLRIKTDAPSTTVFGNLTVTNPTANGWSVAYACGVGDGGRPWASSINYKAGQTIANFIAVRTNATGEFCVYTTSQTDVVFDKVATSDNVVGGNPSRVVDTREGAHAKKVDANSVLRVKTDAPNTTVFGNFTITNPEGDGHAVVYPCTGQSPLASSINYKTGQTVAVFVGVRTDENGEFCVKTSAKTDIIFDKVATSDAILTRTPHRLLDSREHWGDDDGVEHDGTENENENDTTVAVVGS